MSKSSKVKTIMKSLDFFGSPVKLLIKNSDKTSTLLGG